MVRLDGGVAMVTGPAAGSGSHAWGTVRCM